MKRKLYRTGDDSAERYTLSWTERDHPAVSGLYQTSSDVYKPNLVLEEVATSHANVRILMDRKQDKLCTKTSHI